MKEEYKGISSSMLIKYFPLPDQWPLLCLEEAEYSREKCIWVFFIKSSQKNR